MNYRTIIAMGAAILAVSLPTVASAQTAQPTQDAQLAALAATDPRIADYIARANAARANQYAIDLLLANGLALLRAAINDGKQAIAAANK